MSDYPLTVNHFQVEWGGTKIGFMEVEGLALSMDVIETRQGASPEFSMTKMPGMQKYDDIVLKRCMHRSDNEFYEWFNTVRKNKIERRDITIALLNEEHEPVVVWKIKSSFPKRVEYSPLNSASNEPAMETIVLVHEGITVLHT